LRAKALPRPSGRADDGGVYGCHFPPWRHHRGLSLPLSMARALQVKIQASVSRGGRRRRQRQLPLVGVALVSHLWRLRVASLVFGVSGRRGSGPGWWLCIEAAASGSMAGRSFMGWCRCSHVLGGNLVSLVWRGCRLGRWASEEVVLLLGRDDGPGC
jgi:hypothetical protein